MEYYEKLVASTKTLPKQFWVKTLEDCINSGALRKSIDHETGNGFTGGRIAGELFYVLTQPDTEVWSSEIAAAVQMDTPYWLIKLLAKTYHHLPDSEAVSFAKWVVSTVPAIDKDKAKNAYTALSSMCISRLAISNTMIKHYAEDLKSLLHLTVPDVSFYEFFKKSHEFRGHVTSSEWQQVIALTNMYPRWDSTIPLVVSAKTAPELAITLKNLLG